MIVLWGRPDEAPLADVRRALARAGAPTFFFDEARIEAAALDFDPAMPHAGSLRIDGMRLDLAAVTAAYFRPYGARRLLAGIERTRHAEVAQRVDALASALWAWADITPARVLNRPALMQSNATKPLQARMLAALGFAVPPTLVTTDADRARAFIAEHRAVIYKSIGGTRSIVSRCDASAVARLDDIAVCPVQFQAYVPGVDVRVHVVGDELFACEIRSDADDYRYSARSGGSTTLVTYSLPAEIAERCRRTSRILGLPLCGIDLRRTPDGRWIAFEVNPSPGYSYFANATGAPIAQAIATLLMTDHDCR